MLRPSCIRQSRMACLPKYHRPFKACTCVVCVVCSTRHRTTPRPGSVRQTLKSTRVHVWIACRMKLRCAPAQVQKSLQIILHGSSFSCACVTLVTRRPCCDTTSVSGKHAEHTPLTCCTILRAPMLRPMRLWTIGNDMHSHQAEQQCRYA